MYFIIISLTICKLFSYGRTKMVISRGYSSTRLDDTVIPDRFDPKPLCLNLFVILRPV